MKRDQFAMKTTLDKDKMQVERERIAAQREVADKNLQIARENKNKYDVNPNKTEDMEDAIKIFGDWMKKYKGKK